MKNLILCSGFIFLVGCASTQTLNDGKAFVKTKRSLESRELSHADSQRRANRISNVGYDLLLELDNKSETFSGASTISFDLKKVDHLTVDFTGGEILKVFINGSIAPIYYNNNYVVLDKEFLKKGKNLVLIEFHHPYSKTGAGLYRFLDPKDKRTYIYSDFQPFDANRMFPHFDQPDLKATYRLKVSAPRNWVVVSAAREESSIAFNGKRIWTFPQTLPFSSYLLSLHAGPYKVWRSKYKDIPLRLLARRSLAKYVKPKEWFQATQQGFEFFNSYFDYNYPFKKYDQIIVPDFNAGAMENVAAVTFSENYVRKGKKSYHERQKLASVILHEMAHMWFGNLVTMKWWNDLWLNESFATYMAALAMFENTEFKTSWKNFYARYKQWAYWEDQLITTHPIDTLVQDTGEAFTNFDGITYGKGASLLKQAAYYIGEEAFQKGVQNYFKTYAFKNAERRDFFAALAKAANKDLDSWSEEWIQKTGLNTISVSWQCENGKIKNFTVNQFAPKDYPTLRTHKTLLGLYSAQQGKPTLLKEQTIVYSGEKTQVEELRGVDCPEAVYPNYKDYDYVKVELDQRSQKFFSEKLSQLDESFDRLMVWQTFWDMVRDHKMDMQSFANLILKNLPSEKDISVLSKALRTVNQLGSYLTINQSQHLEKRNQIYSSLENFLWKNLRATKFRSEQQILWYEAYVGFAHSQPHLRRLASIYYGKTKLTGIAMDLDRRWDILQTLSAGGYRNARRMIRRELRRDSSAKSKKAALRAEALYPNLKNKNKWFNRVSFKESEYSVAESRSIISGLFPARQKHFTKNLQEDFYLNLLELVKIKEDVFLRSYASLVPTTCEQDSVKKLSNFLQKGHPLTSVTTKKLKVALDEDRRCIRIQDYTNRILAKTIDNQEPK